jgi:hypothetical protein
VKEESEQSEQVSLNRHVESLTWLLTSVVNPVVMAEFEVSVVCRTGIAPAQTGKES